MRKLSALILLFVLTVINVKGQSENPGDWCLTDQMVEEYLENHPEEREAFEKSLEAGPEEEMFEFLNTRSGPIIVPVVFHVIHDNCVGNVDLEQLENAIDILNEDFRRLNADTSNTRAIFRNIAADAGIEFRLAKLDPDGNCTDGVVRVNDPARTYNVRNEPKEVSYWPADRYFNIWLVNSIRGGSGGGTVMGFAQFPGSGPLRTFGIVQRHDRTGRIGTAAGRDGRTLTHEVGHCFNLLHTFQSGCGDNCNSSGDRVCDTPPTSDPTFGCRFNQNTCSNDLQGPSPFTQDMPDQVENYMSYDQNGCQNMFTQGQVTRMIRAINNNGFLTNLVSNQNLRDAGVLDFEPRLCRAEFEVDGFPECETDIIQICQGQELNFINRSLYSPEKYEWNFWGGSPESSTDENPAIRYNTAGIFSVQLKAKSGSDQETIMKENFIRVLPAIGAGTPMMESFEFDKTLILKGWVAQQFESGFGWEHTDRESYSGQKSVRMRNFNYSEGRATLTSENYSLANISNPQLAFYTAYSNMPSESSATLMRVEFSGDCGNNWQTVNIITNPQLSSAPEMTTPLRGLSANNWRRHTINIPQFANTTRFQFRLVFEGDGGNDLYLDDINITGDLNTDVPALVSPFNNANPVALNPNLNWNPARGSLYEVQWSKNEDFSGAESRIISIGSNLANGSDTRTQLEGLDPFTNYYWRVRTITATSAENPWTPAWVFTTGDESTSARDIKDKRTEPKVYPNPASNVVFLEEAKGILQVFDVRGSLLLTRNISDNQRFDVDVSRLTPGLYLFRMQTDEGVHTRRVIISRLNFIVIYAVGYF